MGEFFKEEKKPEKKENELIEDPQDLFAIYDVLRNKIQLMKDDSYEAIMPIRTELMGTEDSAEDSGQIGDLRKRLKISRISSMTIGTVIWRTLKNIEDLDRWSERYIDYTDKYFDSYQLITRSAFKIISNLHTEINKLRNRINELQERLPQMKPVEMPKKEQGPIKSPRIDIFEELLDEKIEGYRNARKAGDEIQIEEARRQLLAICGTNYSKKKKVQEVMNKIDFEKKTN